MKSINQTTTVDKEPGQVTKTATLKSGKSAPRKSASPAKRPSRAAKKRPLHEQSTFAGYSDSAARLIARGKSAFGDAYAWAGEAGSSIPRTTRHLGLPDQKSLRAMIDDRPLIIGAVGLGIGVALGSMLPSAGHVGNEKRRTTRPSRRK
jgi:hypothetical protein